MGKRRENRVFVSIPVVVTGIDQNGNSFAQTTHTVDVSHTGARLNGIRCFRGVGEMITLECGSRSARFMLVWIGRPGSTEDGEFGVRALEPEKRIFKVTTGDPRPDLYHPPPSKAQELSPVPAPSPAQTWDRSERRGYQRHPCSGTAQITQRGVAFPIWARVSDLSLGGCYLELIFAMPRHSPLELILTINDRRLAATGTVVTSHPGIGVGVRFNNIGYESRRVLHELIRELSTSRSPVRTNVGVKK